MTNDKLIELAKDAMKDLWEINQGRLLKHEQTAYNCLRLFCDRIQTLQAEKLKTIEDHKKIKKAIVSEYRKVESENARLKSSLDIATSYASSHTDYETHQKMLAEIKTALKQ